jgi:hypothetical protein
VISIWSPHCVILSVIDQEVTVLMLASLWHVCERLCLAILLIRSTDELNLDFNRMVDILVPIWWCCEDDGILNSRTNPSLNKRMKM